MKLDPPGDDRLKGTVSTDELEDPGSKFSLDSRLKKALGAGGRRHSVPTVSLTMANVQGLAVRLGLWAEQAIDFVQQGFAEVSIGNECVSDDEDPVLCCLQLEARRGLQGLLEQLQTHPMRRLHRRLDCCGPIQISV